MFDHTPVLEPKKISPDTKVAPDTATSNAATTPALDAQHARQIESKVTQLEKALPTGRARVDNSEAVLKILESVSDRDKGSFLDRCREKMKNFDGLLSGALYEVKKSDAGEERCRRAQEGFKAEKQAKVILDNCSGLTGPSDQPAIVQALKGLDSKQVEAISLEIIKAGKTLDGIVGHELTGLSRIQGLKALGKADYSNTLAAVNQIGAGPWSGRSTNGAEVIYSHTDHLSPEAQKKLLVDSNFKQVLSDTQYKQVEERFAGRAQVVPDPVANPNAATVAKPEEPTPAPQETKEVKVPESEATKNISNQDYEKEIAQLKWAVEEYKKALAAASAKNIPQVEKPAPEPEAKYSVRYTNHERKACVFDERKMIDLVSKSFDKEVKGFAARSNYNPGWEKQIARLVVEEALSKKDLSSGGVELTYGEMKAAGLVVWHKMNDKNLNYNKLLAQPPVENVHDRIAATPTVEKSVAVTPVVDIKDHKSGKLYIQEHPEHKFFAEFVGAYDESNIAKIDSFIERIDAMEKLSLVKNISQWKDQGLTNQQKFLVDKAVVYLEHKIVDPTTSPMNLFESIAREQDRPQRVNVKKVYLPKFDTVSQELKDVKPQDLADSANAI